LAADLPALDDVEGIGEIRARTKKQSLKECKNNLFLTI
jgi:DNA integrity scanning protein DisA with diadenylate cyclase activity